MITDLVNFIAEDGLKIYLSEIKGWSLVTPILIDGVAVVNPDFYPNNYVIARSKKGYIYACGDTRIKYRDEEYSSTQELLDKHGTKALDDFQDWLFLEEKEWVVTKTGLDWLHSFTTLDKWPKRTKLRC